jgi:hypothetical protein
LYWNTEADIVVDSLNGAMTYAIGRVGKFPALAWGEPETHFIVQSISMHFEARSLHYT